MKQKFSTKWKSSKQPRKQRKYIANAPLHLKRKMLGVNLSKSLRKTHGIRNVVVRKGDTVKILRGKFKGKQGKVNDVKIKMLKIYVEGIQAKKKDSSKINVPLRASNLQIIELDTSDKKRLRKKTENVKNETPKKEDSKELNKEKEKR
jgi:large subunit ribosomal protein L24